MKISIKNIIAYIQGNIRYKLWYSKYKFLIPLHIREQIEMRIASMNVECYNQGSCVKCGCQTTHLQMANKACNGNCYPKMLSKNKWSFIKKNNTMVIDKVLWLIKKNKFKSV
jgi:hypothetical protein